MAALHIQTNTTYLISSSPPILLHSLTVHTKISPPGSYSLFTPPMASSAVTMGATVGPTHASAGLKKSFLLPPRVNGIRSVGPRSSVRLVVRATSGKEQVVAGLTAAALVAAMVIPEVAEAAQPGISPSLKNFLLSILSGGIVLGVIVGAVLGVANFDPVKRN